MFKKLWLIFVFLILVNYVSAAPDVTHIISGSFIDGGNITIGGSDFGYKENPEPLIWETFESGSLNSRLDSTGEWGIDTDNPVEYEPKFSSNNLRTSGQLAEFTGLCGGIYGYQQPESAYQWDAIFKDELDLKKYFVSSWNWFDPDLETIGYKGKWMRSYSGSGLGEYPGMVLQGTWALDPIQNYWQFDGLGGAVGTLYLDVPLGSWKRFSRQIDLNTPGIADGYIKIWHGQTSSREDFTVPFFDFGDDSFHSVLRWETYCKDCPSGECYMNTFYDDIYVDDTWARLELCDASNYDFATHCELQLPHTNWEDNTIKFTTNFGSFDGTEDLYLFVVDEYGVVSDGFSITSADSVCEAVDGAACYYIDPDGSDSNQGTFESPFASTNPIIDIINPGDYIYFRGGAYGPASQGQNAPTNYPPNFPSMAYLSEVSGTPGHPITFKAYPGELPIIDMYVINPDFDPFSYGDEGPIHSPVHSPDNAFHLYHSNYIVIKGFEIIHGSILVYGSNNTWIEDNHIHDIYSDRDNNGLITLYFTKTAYVDNNNLHDAYSRTISNERDENGTVISWKYNDVESHEDGQHNGCITTLSGDTYSGGYDSESSGPFELTNNRIHDCPVHLFIKNPQGQYVNEQGVNLLVQNNYFYGTGRLAEHFNAANVLFENNLFKDINGISDLGNQEYPNCQPPHGCSEEILNEISARNVMFQNNVFSNVTSLVKIQGQGYLLANGVYSTEMEDKFKFYNNIVIIDDASTPGTMGWNDAGYLFGNTYGGMMDPTSELPSKILSRIDSTNNCYINKQGENIAFLKHWVNSSQFITGISVSDARNLYNINGEGDLFPDTTLSSIHFNDLSNNDYSIKPGSPCAIISGVGLSDPTLFFEEEQLPVCGDGWCNGEEICSSCPEDCGECPPELVEQTISLVSGWNLVSFNINISNSSSSFNSVFTMRYGVNAWEIDWGIFSGDEFTLQPLRGYYVYSGSDQSITFSGQEISSDYSLVNNTWNLFSVRSSDSFENIYGFSLDSGDLMQVILNEGSFIYSDVSGNLNHGLLYWAKIGDAQFGPVVQSMGVLEIILDFISNLASINGYFFKAIS
jgi:hypothetical protein